MPAVVMSLPVVNRVYVTCMEMGCPNHELYDNTCPREGRRTARQHAAETGHTVCVDEERSRFIGPPDTTD